MPHVVSVSVSMPKSVTIGEMEWQTSIVKEPSAGPVYVTLEGPVGNKSAVHPEAVYSIGVEAYDYWAERLEVDRASWKWGQWGENITFSGLHEKDVRIGDILEVGDELVMEVSAPRNPCVKLSWRLGQPATLLKTLIESGIMGFYLRVLKPGPVKAGDQVRLRSPYPDNMAIIDIPRLYHDDTAPSERVRVALEMPGLSDYAKMFLRQRLSQSLDNETTRKHRWKGWRDFAIEEIVQESDDVRSFVLAPCDGEPIAGFRAGQFLTFALPDGKCGRLVRQWSISDYGDVANRYRISVKRAPQGTASVWLYDEAVIGTKLQAKAPAGRFALDIGSTKPIFFVSAGIGVTPLLAMLKAHLGRKAGQVPPVVWIHAARNGTSHAFRREVSDLIATSGADIRTHIFYSAPDATDIQGRDYDYAGRLTVAELKRIAGIIDLNLAGKRIEIPGQICEYYICGPDAMQRDLVAGLREWGAEEFSIHTETFAPPKARSAGGVEQAEVQFAASGLTATWRRDEAITLLDLAESLGIEAQSSCRMGACHSCASRLASGSVDHMVETEGLAPSQVLLCSAVPASPLVVLDL